VSKSNSLKLRERIISQTQQLESERQNNAREHERLHHQLESQAKLLEETEAHLDELRASSNHRLSRIGDDANISVYHARITALETRLDQLEGENEETEVRYREVVAENAALREQLTEVDALKTDAHSLIQEMRSRLIAAEARSQEFIKKQAEVQALVHSLEAEKKGLLQAKKAVEEHEEHEIEHEKNKHTQQVESLMQEMDSLRARYEEVDGLATRLRSQVDALSNEHADCTAKAEQDRTTYQDALSDTTRRVHELEQALKDEAAKSEGMQREVNLKNDELTHLREVLDDVDVKRARSTRRVQQPSPPHTFSTASSLHPHPTNPFGFISGGSPSHLHARMTSMSERGGHAKQRSVSGSSSMSGSIRDRDQDRGHDPVPSAETPLSPESPPATKAKRSTRQRLSSLFGVHIGHHHQHHHGSEDPGSGSGSGSGSGAGSGAAVPPGGPQQSL